MLEGLEISEILLSRVPFENTVLRIDSEYFLKKYLSEDVKRQKYATVYLGSEYFITDGQHGYHEVDEKSSIRHLTAKNFKNWFADDIGADRIAQWVDDNNRRSSLMENDLVMTTRGTVGFCALVKRNVLPANIDQDVARIAQLNGNRISPHFLVSYINTRFGQDWTKRNQTGMVQQGLALWRVKELPVPLLATSFQKRIEEIVEKAYSFKSSSVNFYFQAETLLRDTIIIKDFQPSNDPVNIKSFKESFLRTGRLDSEYYQKKYEEYSDIIRNYPNGYSSLESICTIKDKNFIPDDEQLYKYIELSDIGNTGDISGFTFEKGNILPTRARRLINSNDVIISSIEGSLNSCALVTEEYNNSLCSTGFYIINSTEINSETLLILFKSAMMQNVLKQNCSGTILTAINKDEFYKIPIPIVDKMIQNKIKEKIVYSFVLKKQSEQLLEAAKRAVEIAIEEDEQAAMKYIEEKVNTINTLKNDH